MVALARPQSHVLYARSANGLPLDSQDSQVPRDPGSIILRKLTPAIRRGSSRRSPSHEAHAPLTCTHTERGISLRSLPLALLSLLAVSGTTLAQATALPVGIFSLSGQTTTTGIHTSPDQGTLSGALTFNANSTLTSANLTFNDLTAGRTFTFTNVGPTSVSAGNFVSATIANAVNPAEYYAFSVRVPSLASGSFTLTCGVDCDTDAESASAAVFSTKKSPEPSRRWHPPFRSPHP